MRKTKRLVAGNLAPQFEAQAMDGKQFINLQNYSGNPLLLSFYRIVAGIMPTMASKGEKTRNDIIACAKNLFYQHGYEATSFSEIVSASGLFRGNIYHYFKSKDDILAAVIAQRRSDYRAYLNYLDTQHPEPKQRLLAFVDMVARNADLMEYGCPIGSLNTELGKERRDLQLDARELFDVFRDWLAQQMKALGYGEQAETLGLHLLGRGQGISVIAHVYRDAKVLQNETQLLREWVQQL